MDKALNIFSWTIPYVGRFKKMLFPKNIGSLKIDKSKPCEFFNGGNQENPCPSGGSGILFFVDGTNLSFKLVLGRRNNN